MQALVGRDARTRPTPQGRSCRATGRRRRAASVALLAAVVSLGAAPAYAADDEPILTTSSKGTDAVTFTVEDGTASAELTVTNPGAEAITLAPVGAGGFEACTAWSVAPTVIPADRTATVKVTTTCDLPRTGQVRLDLTSGSTIATLEATVEDEAPRVAWWTLLWAFASAAVAALLVAGWVKRKLPGWPQTVRWDASTHSFRAESPRAPLLGDKVPGLEPGWSFSDSWATSVSTLGTLLIALLGTTDILKAVLGSEPTAVLANLLVAGAIAAFLAGAAPFVMTAVGKTTDPTLLGVLLAGGLTMTGVGGQVAVLGWQVGVLAGIGWLRWLLAVVLAALVLLYCCKTLLLMLRGAFETPAVEPTLVPLKEAVELAAQSASPGTDADSLVASAREIRRAIAFASIGIVAAPSPTPTSRATAGEAGAPPESAPPVSMPATLPDAVVVDWAATARRRSAVL